MEGFLAHNLSESFTSREEIEVKGHTGSQKELTLTVHQFPLLRKEKHPASLRKMLKVLDFVSSQVRKVTVDSQILGLFPHYYVASVTHTQCPLSNDGWNYCESHLQVRSRICQEFCISVPAKFYPPKQASIFPLQSLRCRDML